MGNTKYDDKFYRLPKRLFKEEQFRSTTNEAKALYMILLDRVAYQSVMVMHGEMNMELHLSFLQSKK